MDCVERPLNQCRRIGAGLLCLPKKKQTSKCREEEVSASASRINELELIQPEDVYGWRKGAIQNEVDDEARRLAERIPLSGRLR